MEQGKYCTKCGEWKLFTEYHRNTKTKDGHVSRCKECTKKYTKQFYKDNVAYYKNITRHYKSEKSEWYKEYMKKYQKENAEKIKSRKKKQYQNNVEYYKEISKQRYKDKPEYFKQYGRKYRQSERGREADFRRNLKRRSNINNVEFTSLERKEILERDNWTCQCCGIKVHDRKSGNWNTNDKAEIDHIIPISKGGNSELNNLQVLCRTCNRSKFNSMDYIEQIK